MKEKNIELSNLNSSTNPNNNFSFTQNQIQNGNKIIIQENESVCFNSMTNMTVDSNITNNKPRRFTNSGYKKNKTKTDKSKNNSNPFHNKIRKKMHKCLYSLINFLYFLSEKNIRIQVGIVYSLLMIILILGIAYIKIATICNIIKTLTRKNYFLFYVNNIIDSQREIKMQLDEINNHDVIMASSEPLLFMRIYTEEMVDNNIIYKDSLILEQNLENFYTDLGFNYELSDDLYKLADIYNESSTQTNFVYNLKNMIPFYFHFSPIMINHLNNCGIKIINFYFVAYGELDCTNGEKTNTMYFKYPLDDLYLGPDSVQKNNKIYDFIIDPYSSCNNDYEGQEEIINNIKIYNWFSRYLRDSNVHFKVFTIRKITEEKKRKDYLILYSHSNSLGYDNNKFFFTFSMKISKNDEKYPFIILDERDDILNFDFLSIYNFKNKFSYQDSDNTNIQKLFKIDYDIDDNQYILLKSPKFISNINLYSMEEIESEIKRNNLNNGEYGLLKYEEMTNISKYYDINYYFTKDSLIFRLIYFLNKFFLFKKNHPAYLTSIYNEQLSNELETSSDHPCIFSGSKEYYELIRDDYDYDCLNDYCFYNDCNQVNNDKQNAKDLNFIPNCYCIPLFCRDSQSPITNFHNILKDSNKKINKSFSDNSYAFTSTYDDYLIKKKYNFSKIDEYFDRNNFIFKCKLEFYQKNKTHNNIFKTKIKIQDLTYQNGDNTFLMFFMNNNMTSFVVSNFLSLNLKFLSYVSLIYIFFLFCSLVILIRYIISEVVNLINRMEKIKKIRKTIISNKIDNNNINNDENINNISDQNNYNESMINLNIDINNNSFDSIENNKKKKKEKKLEKNKKVGEFDELDNLIRLINENAADFQIKFNLTDDMNSAINEIKNQYNGIIKVNQYKNKLLMNNYSNNNKNNIDEDEMSNVSISSTEEKIEDFNELSLKMFYELLSTSTTELDFSNIKNNFYYRDYDEKLLFGLEEILTFFNDEDSNGNGEITNLSKIQNAIKYYYVNIHNYWKEQYDNLKKEEK